MSLGVRRLVLVSAVVLLSALPLASAQAEGPSYRRHAVGPGETLLGIAAQYQVDAEDLARLNSLADPNFLREGQELAIPAGTTPEPARGERSQPAPVAVPSRYIVTAGDTLWGIAIRFGLLVEDLIRLNGLASPHWVRPGDELRLAAGEPGPARPASTPTPGPGPARYTVAAGDTLWDIATRFRLAVEDLIRLNGLASPNLVRVGDELRLAAADPRPAPPTTTASPQPASMPTPAPSSRYTVAPGDTLTRIASLFNVGVSVLAQLNGLVDPYLIRAGQDLLLPPGAQERRVTTPRAAPGSPGAGAEGPSRRPESTPTPAPAPAPAPNPTVAATPVPPTVVATPVPPASSVVVRVTFYCMQGRMSSGRQVYLGAAAADWSVFPRGTVLEVESFGRYVVEDRFAEDRGQLRLDLWTPDCAVSRAAGWLNRRVTVRRET